MWRAAATKPKYSCSRGSHDKIRALAVSVATAKLTHNRISPNLPTPVAMLDVSIAILHIMPREKSSC